MIYFLRTQSLEVGKNFEITVVDSGRIFRVPVAVRVDVVPLVNGWIDGANKSYALAA